MHNNQLVLKPIDSLLEYEFYVPSYQRGYRWTSNQVKALLDDIWKFRSDSQDGKKEEFYCLQPIAVSKNDNKYIVIDGQQRLTTILIILSYLDDGMKMFNKSSFKLSYETRESSASFLQNIETERENENIDYYHISQAYKTVKYWFETVGGTSKINFLTTLLNDNETGKNVKVIWYEVGGDENHIDIFTRLNIGKIPLTNAELIKAVLLQSSNFDDKYGDLRQIQIASEWDQIEKILQNDSFWYFIYDDTNNLKYDTRIEYIFDLIFSKKRNDEYYFTFNKLNEKFEESKNENKKPDVDGLWLIMKRYFMTLEQWYNDRELYHLIGFLITSGKSINILIDRQKGQTKIKFKEYLRREIRSLVDCQLDELDYTNGKQVRSVLLLFNIQTLLSTESADIRFPFHKYKQGSWDIEHVRSQTDKKVPQKDREQWLIDMLTFFQSGYPEKFNSQSDDEKSSKIMNQIDELLNARSINDDKFDRLWSDLRDNFKELDKENIDSIANLALLDTNTNRSYKNIFFPVKRQRIMQRDMDGVFIPICTKNLFMKYYSQKMESLFYWTDQDANDYLKKIKEVLKDYLPTQNIRHESIKE
ncbi:MAG: DUF262 domain-containing protein [Bacteroidota bacterium]